MFILDWKKTRMPGPAKISALLALLLAALIPARAAELPPVSCDVLVVGGGSAGICAATQSGRAGAKTILLEVAHQVGGNTTTGGVNFPGLFHAWGRQVIAGAGWELVARTVELDGGELPDFSRPTGRRHWKHQVKVNIPLFVALAEEMLRDANVRVLYHTSPVHIKETKNGWSVIISGAGDMRTVFCKQLVDCTGNGAVAALLGLERLRGEERQPGSFAYKIKLETDPSKLDARMVRELFEEAVKAGRVQRSDCRNNIMGFLKQGGDIHNYVNDADNSTAESRAETNMRGRASMLRMYRFLKTVPGLEDSRLESMAPEVGVRETWRVACEYMVTHEDYTSGRRWDDSVCYSFYPIDLHIEGSGVKPAHLKEGVVATVPLRALIPKGSKNVLVAGRCLGSDRLANSALRVQATCMATGQAAGAAAALAALRNTTPGEVPLPELKTLLKQGGAIVPE